MQKLSDGLILVVKRECATCTMIEPVMAILSKETTQLSVYSQDDSNFLESVENVIDDQSLEISFQLNIETVPTLIKVEGGKEIGRQIGWHKKEWQSLTGISSLGDELPDQRPGCGSKSVEPGVWEALSIRFGTTRFQSRQLELTSLEDDIEACFDRGWTDGLPVVPPTRERVLRMMQGTQRESEEVIGIIPPNYGKCTVEKAAINAVMAGCKPEYLPVVIAAIEAACLDAFCMHGLLATTYFSGPIVIVNGPVRRSINMNSGINALGQGNRANATIGRALQLVIRNVGGGKPGEVDRATLGNPGKFSFCFAEDEENSPWNSLADEYGYANNSSTVTLFAGHGLREIYDQISRTPESLVRSFAGCLKSITHPKICMAADAILVVSPEHANVFKEAGWSKNRLKQELKKLLTFKGSDIVRGTNGIEEGLPVEFADIPVIPKFKEDGLIIVHAGGSAGRFSAAISGWVASGPTGSQMVSKEILS